MSADDYPMLPVEVALGIVLEQASPLSLRDVDLGGAWGLILAEAAIAQEAMPPFPASIKDGYAVVAADGPGDYPVVGNVTAGRVADFVVQPGQIAYITTGAPVPAGADAVVMVEETEPLPVASGEGVSGKGAADQLVVHVRQQVKAGADIRPIGSDIDAGQEVLPVGARLGAAEIGLLATVGITKVRAYPRPRVAVLSTGDELVEPGEVPGPGQIRDSNRAMLLAAIRAAGGDPIDLGIASDHLDDITQRVEQGLREADILITSGGVSMGDLDLMKPIFEKAGTIHFGRLRMKPGKPCTFGTVAHEERKKLFFGLPGNPVSSLVTFYLLVVPTIRQLAGWSEPHLRRIHAVTEQPLRLDSYRPEYHRATVRWDASMHGGQGGYRAFSTGNQISSRLLSMRTANVLLELPQAEGVLPVGSVVSALVIGDL